MPFEQPLTGTVQVVPAPSATGAWIVQPVALPLLVKSPASRPDTGLSNWTL